MSQLFFYAVLFLLTYIYVNWVYAAAFCLVLYFLFYLSRDSMVGYISKVVIAGVVKPQREDVLNKMSILNDRVEALSQLVTKPKYKVDMHFRFQLDADYIRNKRTKVQNTKLDKHFIFEIVDYFERPRHTHSVFKYVPSFDDYKKISFHGAEFFIPTSTTSESFVNFTYAPPWSEVEHGDGFKVSCDDTLVIEELTQGSDVGDVIYQLDVGHICEETRDHLQGEAFSKDFFKGNINSIVESASKFSYSNRGFATGLDVDFEKQTLHWSQKIEPMKVFCFFSFYQTS